MTSPPVTHRSPIAAKALRTTRVLLSLVICMFLMCAVAGAADEFCDVYVGQEKLFAVSNTKLMPALERAQLVSDTIQNIINDPPFDPDALTIRTSVDGVPVIFLKDKPICSVTKADADEAGTSQQLLAQEWAAKLKRRLKEVQSKQASSSTESPPPVAPGKSQAARRGSSNLSEHAVLLLFIEITLLLSASLICGEILSRLGQPSIIGQILAGLLLGQTFFGALFPDLSSQLFPRDGSQSRLIEVISWIGVSFILMLTGMETNVAMLRRLGKPLLWFGLIGLFGPLIAGGIISLLLPGQFMGDLQNKLAFAVFLGTVFAASSVPVVAKVLMDLKMFKLSIGQLVVATALAHDLLCCLLLAVIVVLSGSGSEGGGNPLLLAVVGTAVFLAVMYLGRPVFFTVLRWINHHVSTSYGLITAMVVLLLACAATTQALGVHIVLGAFAAGVILSHAPVINHKVVRPLETVTMAFFAPIFFASSCLNVNLGTLLEPRLGMVTLLLALATVAVKLASCYGAGKIARYGKWESLAIGVGCNTKGSLGLILGMLGYSLDIISLDMYASVIFISLFSTAASAPLMKFTMGRVKVTDEEIADMKREERRSRTILSSIRRVLWPTSGRGRNTFIAKLLNSIGQTQVIETTALWVQRRDGAAERPFAHIDSVVDKRHVSVYASSVQSDDPQKVISEEGNRGYDLIVMASDEPPADARFVFGQLVDNVILNTSTRVLVIYDPDPTTERHIKKVLVPVSGKEVSVAAAEFGISLAKALNAHVTCLSIMESEASDLYSEATKSGMAIERNVSNEITNSLNELSNALDVNFESLLIQTAAHPAQAAILTAQQHDIDLIVLGAEPKIGKGLFVGHTINYILRHAPCAVAVLTLRG
ncbi:MAG TPA: cation:proton antiporter [Candidatus Obscuribacterales bacterium]